MREVWRLRFLGELGLTFMGGSEYFFFRCVSRGGVVIFGDVGKWIFI